MRALRWLTALLTLTALFTLCLAAVMALGQGQAPASAIWAFEDTTASPRDGFHLLTIDAARGIAVKRYVPVPNLFRIDYEASPPQVVQDISDETQIRFILSTLDTQWAVVTPLAVYSATDKRAGLASLVSPSGDVVIYDAASEQMQVFLAGTETPRYAIQIGGSDFPVVSWSPDGTMLAAKPWQSGHTVLISDDTTHVLDVFRDSMPLWSPDGHSVLFSQATVSQMNARISVYDAASGDVLPTVMDVPGRSGTWCDSQTLAFVRVTGGVQHTVQMLDIVTGETRELLGVDNIPGEDVLDIIVPPQESCEWLLLMVRLPNDVTARLYRLSVTTGALTLLGPNATLLSLTADEVTYETTVANESLTLMRAAFNADATPVEIGRTPAQVERILWFDEYRSGVFLRGGQLWRLDLASGTAWPLPLPRRIRRFGSVAVQATFENHH